MLILLTGEWIDVTAQKIPFDNFSVQNGLPQNVVYDMDQDHDGYLWFATQVGAARYDGYEFEYYNTSNGLPDDFVNCIMVAGTGKIWMGTEGGIAVFNGQDFEVYTTNDGLVHNHVDQLTEDLNGNIWVGTKYGISVITGDTIRSYTRADALTNNFVLDIFADSGGGVHVATNPGLTIFGDPFSFEKRLDEEIIRDIIETGTGELWYATQENGIWVRRGNVEQRLGYSEGLTDEVVLSMMEDQQGRIWCGTYMEGLFLYEGGSFRKVSTGSSPQPVSYKILEDAKGRVWILTWEDGVWLYDGGDFMHITVANGLVHNSGEDIFEDRYGNIWIATLGGVSKYGRVIFQAYDRDFGLPETYIHSVFRDSRDRIWFGTNQSLMNIQNGHINRLTERSGFPEGVAPMAFAEDEYQNIYIGAGKELLRYNGRSMKPVLDLPWSESRIYSLLYTPDHRIWCATDSGVYILNEGRVTILGEKEGLVNVKVNAMELVGDRICCATEGGVSFFDLSGQHLFNLTTGDGLVSDVCLDLTQDHSGQVWVATNRGISRFSPLGEGSISNYTSQNGLSSNSAFFIEFVTNNTLWIGTERGINVFHIDSGEIGFYGFEDGFRQLETNSRAIAEGTDGELWIGTVSGLVKYNPKHDLIDTVPPDLILYPPLVEGVVYSSESDGHRPNRSGFPSEPSFPYNKNSLTFNFTAIQTTIPSRNRFSFVLEGLEDKWSLPGEERSFSYTRIPSGKYVFKVMAFNADGIPSRAEASFAFTIRPPFWKTGWFISIEVLLALLLIFMVIKYRERQLIREKRTLELKVKERTREIEDQKVEIEAQRDEITEQKNYVEQQRDKIAFQNKEITDSIQYARRIQQAVLPGKLTLERTLPGHFILFKPRDIVSGDFYWVEEKSDRIFVCAADSTGHGVPGAFMSLLGLTFLNEIVNKDEVMKAGEILNRLRTYIISSMSHKDEETDQARDGMDLALVVIDRQLHMLEYAGAYNPLLIIRNDEIIEYKADKMPVGKHVGEEGSFKTHKIDLLDQDMIYLFSDGFADQFGGENGSKYKAKPFKRFLHRISTIGVEQQAEMLEQELAGWMGQEDQVDDILVMGIRYERREPK